MQWDQQLFFLMWLASPGISYLVLEIYIEDVPLFEISLESESADPTHTAVVMYKLLFRGSLMQASESTATLNTCTEYGSPSTCIGRIFLEVLYANE